MGQPLAGMRVADFSHVIAGPLATHFLRLMGQKSSRWNRQQGMCCATTPNGRNCAEWPNRLSA